MIRDPLSSVLATFSIFHPCAPTYTVIVSQCNLNPPPHCHTSLHIHINMGKLMQFITSA